VSIALDYITINDCEDSGSWSTVGNASGLADSDYPSKQGSQCVEFDCSATSTPSGIVCDSYSSNIDIEVYEIGVWFLNPVVNENGDRLLQTGDDALRLRLYASSGNYADFYQQQHKNSRGEYNGGWLYLRASGCVGSEDANSGTWTATDVASVRRVAVLIKTSNDNTNKNAAEYGVDWVKAYSKITVTGYKTGTTPYSLQDIYDEDIDKDSGGGVWGVVNKSDTYYSFYSGLEFGDGTNAGAFSTSNEFIYLDQSSDTQNYDIKIKNNFTVTLGMKVTGSDATYAKDGTPVTVNTSPRYQSSDSSKVGPPSFIVESGGVFKCYASYISDFNIVNLGSGGSSVLDIVRCDFYNNKAVYLNSSNLDFIQTKLHFPGTNKSNIGIIYSIKSFEDITVFQATESFTVRTNMTMNRYTASDTTNDLVILDGVTVNVIDSDIDTSSLKRIT